MKHAPCVTVHGLPDVLVALRPRRPITLLSAPDLAATAGCGWWRALVARAHDEAPDLAISDILDCGDAPGRVLEALSVGCRCLVLDPAIPAFEPVRLRVADAGGILLAARPDSLDLGRRGATRALDTWLDGRGSSG